MKILRRGFLSTMVAVIFAPMTKMPKLTSDKTYLPSSTIYFDDVVISTPILSGELEPILLWMHKPDAVLGGVKNDH